jgi:hypothetical protein
MLHKPSVEENLEAERRLIVALREELGIDVSRLHFVLVAGEEDRLRVQAFIREWLSGERNPVVRRMLYSLFEAPGSSSYFDDAKKWHREESDVEAVEVIERVLISYSDKNTKQNICDQLLSMPRKLRNSGIRYLIRQAKTNSELLKRLQHEFDECQYDLEVVSVLAAQCEKDYHAISGGSCVGTRLTGRQCSSLVQWQLPGNEYWFRRAVFVPYYGVVVKGTIVTKAELEVTAERVCVDNQLSSEAFRDLNTSPLALRENESMLLGIAVQGEGKPVRGLVCTALPSAEDSDPTRATRAGRHRPRTGKCSEKYWLGVVDAPVPPEWNLFPKRLLPPDDPIRWMRPE